MDVQQQNWNNLCANHIKDWHGIWTRYSPQGEVTESFQSLRSFQFNQDHTEIFQTNRYLYPDGVKEQNWQFNRESNSLPDGLYHPQVQYMRAFFFPQGAAAWATKKLESGSPFAIELFFMYEDLRHSVAIIYDQNHSLIRTVSIREDSRGFPSQYWSNELNLLPERNFKCCWQGTCTTMTSDLNVSQPTLTQLQFPLAGHKTFFFPDGISLSCPPAIPVCTNFNIVGNWLVNSSNLQQLSINYDDLGEFQNLNFEIFNFKDSA